MTFVLFKKKKQKQKQQKFPSYPVIFLKDHYPLKFVKRISM